MEIKGHAAIVAGGASGLGAATARFLAGQGADVTILDLDDARGAGLAGDIGASFASCNITVEDEVAGAIAAATTRAGRAPRIVVNCAGIGLAARIVGREGKLSTALFRQVIEVNLLGTYHVMSHAAKAMMDLPPLDTGERGVIINTSSAAYEDGQLGQAAYAASKGAIASMCLPAAREFAKPGIRVMAIAPGLFNTPMMEGLPEDTVAEITRNIPFPHRLGAPEEFAHLVGDILRNPYLNGTVIRLDGAVRLPPR